MDIQVEVKGFEEARKRLKRLEPKLRRRVALAANRAGNKVMLEAVKRYAPRRVPQTSGSYIKSGKGGRSPRAPGYISRQYRQKVVKKWRTGPNRVANVVHKNRAFYTRFIVQGRKGAPRRNPFVRMAYLASRTRAEREYRKAFVRSFNLQVRKVKRGG